MGGHNNSEGDWHDNRVGNCPSGMNVKEALSSRCLNVSSTRLNLIVGGFELAGCVNF